MGVDVRGEALCASVIMARKIAGGENRDGDSVRDWRMADCLLLLVHEDEAHRYPHKIMHACICYQ